MVMLVGGDVETFDAMLFQPPPTNALQYMQQSANDFHTGLGQGSVNFYEAIAPRIAAYDYDRMQQLAYAAYRTVDMFWADNRIQELTTMAHFQHAPDNMVRWIMAEPSVRSLYKSNGLDGYGETYIDRHSTGIKETHYDYMVVMDGMVVEDENGDMSSTEYFVEAQPEYDPDYDCLSFNERVDIVNSWTHVTRFLELGGEDPTSKYNGSL